jgi:hypothetical protein
MTGGQELGFEGVCSEGAEADSAQTQQAGN